MRKRIEPKYPVRVVLRLTEREFKALAAEAQQHVRWFNRQASWIIANHLRRTVEGTVTPSTTVKSGRSRKGVGAR